MISSEWRQSAKPRVNLYSDSELMFEIDITKKTK